MKVVCLFVFCLLCVTNTFADIYNPVSVRRQPGNEVEATESYPNVKTELIQEVFLDSLYLPKIEKNDAKIYTLVRPTFNINLNKYFGFDTQWSVEDVNQNYRNPYGVTQYLRDQSDSLGEFKNEGLIVEQANFRLQNKYGKVFAGKFNPTFGVASKRYNKDIFDNNWYGMTGTFLNTGYEMREKLGLGFEGYIHHDNHQKHTISGSAFKSDTSALYNSLFSNKNDLFYPNVAGTNSKFLSYALDIRGQFLFDNDDQSLSYAISTRRQLDKNNASEKGYSAALQYYVFVLKYLKLGTFHELTKISNYNSLGASHQYYTSSFYANYNGFNIALVMNNLKADLTPTVTQTKVSEFSFGYDFNFGFGIYASRRKIDQQVSSVNVDSVSFRYLVKYS